MMNGSTHSFPSSQRFMPPNQTNPPNGYGNYNNSWDNRYGSSQSRGPNTYSQQQAQYQPPFSPPYDNPHGMNSQGNGGSSLMNAGGDCNPINSRYGPPCVPPPPFHQQRLMHPNQGYSNYNNNWNSHQLSPPPIRGPPHGYPQHQPSHYQQGPYSPNFDNQMGQGMNGGGGHPQMNGSGDYQRMRPQMGGMGRHPLPPHQQQNPGPNFSGQGLPPQYPPPNSPYPPPPTRMRPSPSAARILGRAGFQDAVNNDMIWRDTSKTTQNSNYDRTGTGAWADAQAQQQDIKRWKNVEDEARQQGNGGWGDENSLKPSPSPFSSFLPGGGTSTSKNIWAAQESSSPWGDYSSGNRSNGLPSPASNQIFATSTHFPPISAEPAPVSGNQASQFVFPPPSATPMGPPNTPSSGLSHFSNTGGARNQETGGNQSYGMGRNAPVFTIGDGNDGGKFLLTSPHSGLAGYNGNGSFGTNSSAAMMTPRQFQPSQSQNNSPVQFPMAFSSVVPPTGMGLGANGISLGGNGLPSIGGNDIWSNNVSPQKSASLNSAFAPDTLLKTPDSAVAFNRAIGGSSNKRQGSLNLPHRKLWDSPPQNAALNPKNSEISPPSSVSSVTAENVEALTEKLSKRLRKAVDSGLVDLDIMDISPLNRSMLLHINELLRKTVLLDETRKAEAQLKAAAISTPNHDVDEIEKGELLRYSIRIEDLRSEIETRKQMIKALSAEHRNTGKPKGVPNVAPMSPASSLPSKWDMGNGNPHKKREPLIPFEGANDSHISPLEHTPSKSESGFRMRGRSASGGVAPGLWSSNVGKDWPRGDVDRFGKKDLDTGRGLTQDSGTRGSLPPTPKSVKEALEALNNVTLSGAEERTFSEEETGAEGTGDWPPSVSAATTPCKNKSRAGAVKSPRKKKGGRKGSSTDGDRAQNSMTTLRSSASSHHIGPVEFIPGKRWEWRDPRDVAKDPNATPGSFLGPDKHGKKDAAFPTRGNWTVRM